MAVNVDQRIENADWPKQGKQSGKIEQPTPLDETWIDTEEDS